MEVQEILVLVEGEAVQATGRMVASKLIMKE